MTEEKMREALEPCPFCGEMPRLSSSAFHAGYATCQAVNVPEDRWHPAVTMTIEQWNRRASLSTKQEPRPHSVRSQALMSSRDLGCYDSDLRGDLSLTYMEEFRALIPLPAPPVGGEGSP